MAQECRIEANRAFAGCRLARAAPLVGGRPRAGLQAPTNGRVRFATLTTICRALDCQPGDLFTVEDD